MSENKQENKVEETQVSNLESKESPEVTVVVAEAPPPAPKLAPGLFNNYSLGSILVQGASGNVIANVKASPMDYQKQLENSSKNQKMTAEQLKEMQNKK